MCAIMNDTKTLIKFKRIELNHSGRCSQFRSLQQVYSFPLFLPLPRSIYSHGNSVLPLIIKAHNLRFGSKGKERMVFSNPSECRDMTLAYGHCVYRDVSLFNSRFIYIIHKCLKVLDSHRQSNTK